MPGTPDNASLASDQGGDGAGTAAGARQQPLSFALFALLTTASIILVALAAPVVFNGIVSVITDFGWNVPGIAEGGAITWYHLLSFQIATVSLTALMAGVARGRGSTLGWHSPIGHMSWLQPLLIAIVVSAISTIIAFSFFADIVARDLAPIRKMIDAAPVWLAFITLAIGAPLSEELLFRGYLLHRLMQTRLGFWGGALIANAGWTMLHFDYSWLSLADVFLAGLLFSWALWRTRSIWVPIAFHALYNATVFFFLLIPSTKTPVPALW
jgi:membrane protease YdiL (CAAX protease family)